MSHPVAPAVYARTAAARSAIREAPTASIVALLALAFVLCVEGQLVFLPGISGFERLAWGLVVPVSLVAAFVFVPEVLRILREPASLLVFATVLLLAGWTWFVGYPLAVRDVVVLIVPAAAGMGVNRWLKRRYPTQTRFVRRVASLTVFWMLASAFIWAADTITRFVVPHLDAQPAPPADHIGASFAATKATRPAVVALSGGGYRAALFHAGVLDGLEARGIRPSALSTVSGGSIIGAYYGAGGRPRDFLAAVSAGEFRLAHVLVYPHNVFRLVADLRLFASRLVLLPGFGSFSRTHVEANLLDNVFLHERRHDAFTRAPGSRGIPVMPGLTDLRGGRAIGVLPEGAMVQVIAPSITRFHFANADTTAPEPEFRPSRDGALGARDASHQRTSLLVAGSGAFPGAFKPLPLVLPPGLGGPSPRDTVLVADGGIVDNSGVVLAYAANRRARTAADVATRRALVPWRTNLVVASDGSALDVGTGVPGTLPAELSRAVDVMYRSTSGENLTVADPRPPTVSISVTVLAQLLGRVPGRTKAGKQEDDARWRFLVARLRPADLATVFAIDPPGVTSAAEQDLLDAWTRTVAVSGIVTPPPAALQDALRARVLAALGVFIRTPTLKDQVTARHADALYRLGRYAVILFGDELLGASPAREPVP